MFYTFITQPLANVLVGIYQILHGVGLPFALGFSIIVLTILIRLLLYPLIASQTRTSKKMQQIQPHINRLREKHKKDAQRLQMETMQLYKEHGVNPLAGCLPVLLQLPVIWGLYGVLNETVRQTSFQAINKGLYFDFLKLNKLWDTSFFGLPLGQSPSQLMQTAGAAILVVPFITGGLQYIQSRLMFKPTTTVEKEKKSTENDFASAMQTQSLYLFPVMIGFFAYSFPIGLALYWNTFTIFGIIQQSIMNRSEARKTSIASQNGTETSKKQKKIKKG